MWPDDGKLVELSDRHGTPYYLFSEAALLASLRQLRDEFASASGSYRLHVLYSVKNNPLPGIVRVMAANGAWFECSDSTEVALAEAVGAPADACLQTAIWRSREQIEQCLRMGVRRFTIDSLQDLEALESCAAAERTRIDVLLRLNTGIVARNTRLPAAGDSAKAGAFFGRGVDLPENAKARRVLDALCRSAHLRYVGVHGHLGSQVEDAGQFREHADRLLGFLEDTASRLETDSPILDVGGGFPAFGEPAGGGPLSPQSLGVLAGIRDLVESRGFRGHLYVEPGRLITANAGILVVTVVKTLARPAGRRMAILDASVYNVLLDMLVVGSRYPMRVLGRAPSDLALTTLVGLMNDSLDVFEDVGDEAGTQILQVGDRITFSGVGAYTLCFNMNYGFRGLPAALLYCRDGSIRLLRERDESGKLLARLGTL